MKEKKKEIEREIEYCVNRVKYYAKEWVGKREEERDNERKRKREREERKTNELLLFSPKPMHHQSNYFTQLNLLINFIINVFSLFSHHHRAPRAPWKMSAHTHTVSPKPVAVFPWHQIAIATTRYVNRAWRLLCR